MPYSTDEDLFDQLAEHKVRQLTDDDGTGQIDTGIVGRLRAEAGQYVDAYLRARYDLPLPDPAPPLLAQIEADLLAHRLYRRRPGLEIPESVTGAKQDALKLLVSIAKGTITLEVDADGDGELDAAGASYQVRAEDPLLKDLLNRY